MTRKLATGLVLTALLTCLGGPARARQDKASDVKTVMKKLGDGSSGLHIKLGRELRDPTWEDARALSQEMVRVSAGLGKLTPPQGDKASWDRNAKAFADAVTALDQAVARRDQATAQAMWKALEGGACMNCHKVHRKN